MSRFLIIPQLDNIKESLALSEEYGFGFEYNDFFLPAVLDDRDRLSHLIRRYKENPLPDYCTLHGAFFDILVFSEDSAIREISERRIRQSLDAAREMGAAGAVFHTNHNPLLKTPAYVEGWLARNEDFWGRLLPEYPDVNIYIENMFDSSPDMLAELARRLQRNKNFGVCFDYAHATIFGDGGIGGWVESLTPYLRHMHINDNDLHDDLHLAVGEGLINWERFKSDFEGGLCRAESVLIETSQLCRQRRSAEFLTELGILHR